jgi:hypothetical protein
MDISPDPDAVRFMPHAGGPDRTTMRVLEGAATRVIDSSSPKPPHCVCRGYEDTAAMMRKDIMICCDKCKQWFHSGCVGLSNEAASSIASYSCVACATPEDYLARSALLDP